MNIEKAKERLKKIVDFYKLNDPNNYDYDDRDLISMRLVLEEIERLNNIIEELEKLLKEEKTRTRYANDVERFTAYDFILKRLQELKGSDKNE